MNVVFTTIGEKVVRITITIFALMIASSSVLANEASMFDEIEDADQKFFVAFNACDLEAMGNIFSKDLEFYHDISGFAGYDQTLETMKTNCDNNLGLVRKLVEGSMEVSPLGDFGAMQKGRHTFCHEVEGKNDCGTFEFLHVWRRSEHGWRLHRVVSYGH